MIKPLRFAAVFLVVITIAAVSGNQSQAFGENLSTATEIGFRVPPVPPAASPSLPECGECYTAVVRSGAEFAAAYELTDIECDQTSEHCYPCTGFGSVDCYDSGTVYGPTNFPDSASAVAWIADQEGCGTCEDASKHEIPELIEAGAEYQLAHIIEASEGRVWLNRQRSAIQGLACADAIGMHLPISPDLVHAISEALRESDGVKSP